MSVRILRRVQATPADGLWRAVLLVGAIAAGLLTLAFEFSALRPTGKPTIEAVISSADVHETYRGTRGRLVVDLASGTRVRVYGLTPGPYAIGTRVLVQEYRTPILGLPQYRLVGLAPHSTVGGK
jgi:hypothetical protein